MPNKKLGGRERNKRSERRGLYAGGGQWLVQGSRWKVLGDGVTTCSYTWRKGQAVDKEWDRRGPE